MERKKKFFRKKRGVASSVFSWLLVFAMVISNVSVSPGLLLTVQAAESEVGTESTGETQEMDGVGSGETAQTTEGSGGEEDVQPAETGGTGETTDAGGSTESGTAGTEEVTTPETSVETDEAGTTEESSQIPETDTAEETAGTEETLTEETEETATAEETTETETVEEAETVDDIVNDGVTAEQVTITLHINIGYNKNDPWGAAVSVHRWGDGVHNPEEPVYSWPGDAVDTTKKDDDGYYLYNITVDQEKDFNYIINNGDNGKQTIDMMIPASELTEKDQYDLWIAVDAQNRKMENGNSKYVASTYSNIYPQINGKRVTFVYNNSSASSVKLAGTMTDWGNSAEEMQKTGDSFTITKDLAHGEYEYKFIVDGNGGFRIR